MEKGNTTTLSSSFTTSTTLTRTASRTVVLVTLSFASSAAAAGDAAIVYRPVTASGDADGAQYDSTASIVSIVGAVFVANADCRLRLNATTGGFIAAYLTSRTWTLTPTTRRGGRIESWGTLPVNASLSVTKATSVPGLLATLEEPVSRCITAGPAQGLRVAAAEIAVQVQYVGPPPRPIGTAAIATSIAATAASVFVGSSVGAASYAARSNAIDNAAKCDVAGLDDPVDVFSSPLQLSISDDPAHEHLGAVVGNALLIAAFVTAHVAVAAARRWLCLWRWRRSGASRKDAGGPPPRWTSTPLAALTWARFPSVSTFPVLYFAPTLLSSGLTCMIYGDAVWVRLAGAVSAAVVFAVLGLTSRMLLTRTLFRAKYNPSRSALATTDFRALQTWKARMMWLVAPTGEWTDVDKAPKQNRDAVPSFVRRYDILFADYTDRMHWFIIVDNAITALISTFAALLGVSTCNSVQWLLLVLLVAYPMVVVMMHPHESRLNWITTICIGVLQLAGGSISIAAKQVDPTSSTRAALDRAAVAVTFISVVMLLWITGYSTARAVARWVVQRAVAAAKAALRAAHGSAVMLWAPLLGGDAEARKDPLTEETNPVALAALMMAEQEEEMETEDALVGPSGTEGTVSAPPEIELVPIEGARVVTPPTAEEEAARIAASVKRVNEEAERHAADLRERIALVQDWGETMRRLHAMRRELHRQMQRERSEAAATTRHK